MDPRSLHPGCERAGAPPPDPERSLAAALASGEIAHALASVAPPHPEYAALVSALERVRAEQAAGDATTAQRADRLRANLERWRWLPRELGHRHLRVNTPGFTLQSFDSGQVVILLYFTASVGAGGVLSFTDDPYGWDRDLPALDADSPTAERPAHVAHGRITTGVPTSLGPARTSRSASESATQP